MPVSPWECPWKPWPGPDLQTLAGVQKIRVLAETEIARDPVVETCGRLLFLTYDPIARALAGATLESERSGRPAGIDHPLW